MVQKRDVLELLSRDELASIVHRFDLTVTDRRAKDGLISAVAASKKATLAAVLPELSRDRLKELCRALRLNDSGRDKASLVERLTGSKGTEPTATESPKMANGRVANGPTTTTEVVDSAAREPITVDRVSVESVANIGGDLSVVLGSVDGSSTRRFHAVGSAMRFAMARHRPAR